MLKKTVGILLAIIILFPLCYNISLSFFSARDFNITPARFFPTDLNYENYLEALSNSRFARYSINSIITALLASSVRTVLSLLSAYAFTFLNFRGKKFFLFFLLLSAFIPQDGLLYQNYVTVSRMGLLNSYLGIVITSLFSATQLMMLLTAMKMLSKDEYDAARIDGAKDITILCHIIFPLVKGVAITIFIQSFISTFNAYLWPLLVTNTESMRTIQIGIALMGFEESGDLGAMFASLIIVLIPLLLITLFSRKLIIKALSNSLSY